MSRKRMKASSGSTASATEQWEHDFCSLSIHATKSLPCYRAWLQDVQQLRQVEIAAAADDTCDLRAWANHQGNGFDAAFWIGDTICHYFDIHCICVGSCGITAQLGIKSFIYRILSYRKWKNITMDMSNSWSLLAVRCYFWSCVNGDI